MIQDKVLRQDTDRGIIISGNSLAIQVLHHYDHNHHHIKTNQNDNDDHQTSGSGEVTSETIRVRPRMTLVGAEVFPLGLTSSVSKIHIFIYVEIVHSLIYVVYIHIVTVSFILMISNFLQLQKSDDDEGIILYLHCFFNAVHQT